MYHYSSDTTLCSVSLPTATQEAHDLCSAADLRGVQIYQANYQMNIFGLLILKQGCSVLLLKGQRPADFGFSLPKWLELNWTGLDTPDFKG